ncbi:hypothetical protein KFE98_04640 [bacterium SCSIO 12741]|nr:hypothetical protein KFE98_04640 [bacterium SCSIO 12741]
MVRKLSIGIVAVLIGSLLLLPVESMAQCAMCKLMAESSYESGSDIGRGLNDGITFIMGIPYLLILIGGVYLFRRNMK